MAQQYQVDIVTKVTNVSTVEKLDKVLKQLAVNQDKVSRAANKAAGSQTKFATATRKAGVSAKGASTGVKSLGTSFALASAKITAVIAAVTAVGKALQTGFDRNYAETRLKGLTGSTEEYQLALAEAERMANKFGRSQTAVTAELASLNGRLNQLGFGLKQSVQVYEGFNIVTRKSHASAQDAASAMLQLSQALGSGRLNGDEFMRISESMPAILGIIAKEMGVQVGQLKKMGSEGKITSQIIVSALTKIAEGGEVVTDTFTPMQQAMNTITSAAEEFGVQFGKVFGPVFVSAVQVAGEALNTISLVFQDLAQRYGPLLSAALMEVDTMLKTTFGSDYLEKAQKAFEGLVYIVGETLVKAFVFTLEKVKELVGLFQLLAKLPGLAITLKLAEQIGIKMGDAGDRVQELKEKSKEMADGPSEALDKYSSMPDPIRDARDLVKDQKTATDELNASLQTQKALNDQVVNTLDNQARIAQATFNAESQVLGVRRQAAEAALAQAKTDQQRAKAIRELYEVTVEEAELVYEQTMATAKAEERKMEALMKNAELTLKVARYKAVEAEAAGTVNKAHYKAIQLAEETLNLATENYIAQQQITKEVERGAAAVREKTIAAADTLRQQQLQQTQQEQTNAAIGDGVNKMNQLAQAAGNAAAASQGIGAGGAGGGGGSFPAKGSSFTVWHGDQQYDQYKLDQHGNIIETSEEERRRQMNQAAISRMNAMANQEQIREFLNTMDWNDWKQNGWRPPSTGARSSSSTRMASNPFQPQGVFAEGGYVTEATNALIGEGGEPEYVIPESKMSSAISRYSAGARGEGVINGGVTANVNYSGTTLNFNGDEYVKKSDVGGIVKKATAATGHAMRNSSKYRLENGL